MLIGPEHNPAHLRSRVSRTIDDADQLSGRIIRSPFVHMWFTPDSAWRTLDRRVTGGTTVKHVILCSLLAVGLLGALPAPASAQSIGIGPGGIGVDLRGPGQRRRDFERSEMRREDRREMRRDMRRRDRYEAERAYRRGY